MLAQDQITIKAKLACKNSLDSIKYYQENFCMQPDQNVLKG